MRHTYQFEVFKASGKHRVVKSSLSTKLCLSSVESMLYCQQWALDNQINPDQVSMVHVNTGNYLHKSNCLVNKG